MIPPHPNTLAEAVLIAVCEEPGTGSSTIAKDLELAYPSVRAAVRRLKRWGLLELTVVAVTGGTTHGGRRWFASLEPTRAGLRWFGAKAASLGGGE